MESTAIAGYNGLVYVSSDGGTTFTQVAQLTGVTLTVTADMLDATTKSTAAAGWKAKQPGLLDWNAAAKSLRAANDAANSLLYSVLVGRSLVSFRFDPENTATGKPRYAGDGYLKDWKEDSQAADLTKIDITIEGNGPLALSTQ
jgi:predicted secreted protein